MSNKFSKQEIQFIKDNYTTMSDEEIAHMLGRTKKSIETKRKRLGFKRSNAKYDWSDVLQAFSKTNLVLISKESEFKNCLTKIKYICPNHENIGIQQIGLSHMLNGEGCPYCGRLIAAKKRFIPLNEKYYKQLCAERDYTYLGAERIKGFICIRFICNKHKEFGEQYQSIYNLKRRFSCQYCIGRNLPKWYIDEQIKINNPNIEILSNYTKLTDKVECRCKKHNIISSKKIQNVLRGECCYKCGFENRHSSYREEEISNLLNKWGYRYEREFTFDNCKDKYKLPFDFYLPDYNICIEYDGQHHYLPIFGNDNLSIMKRHDKIKNNYCKISRITLIRIPYWQHKNIEQYLFSEFVKIGVVKLIS